MEQRQALSAASANWTVDLGACVSPTKTKGGAQLRLPPTELLSLGGFLCSKSA